MKSKKLLSVFLSLLLVLGCFSVAIMAQADDLIEINSENFPDPVWRAYVMENYDNGAEPGYLTPEERNVEKMQIWPDDDIADLKGIEYFTSLTTIDMSTIGLETLDVSALSELRSLRVMGNELTSLDVSANQKLEDLNCTGNSNLSSLTLGSGITKLQCGECNLSSLDVSMCTGLTNLVCWYNELTSLDLSNNSKLVELNCAFNHLPSLDVSKSPGLNISSYDTQGQVIISKAYMYNEGFRVPIDIESDSRITYSNIKNPYPDDSAEDSAPVWTGYNTTFHAFEFSDYDLFNTGIIYAYDVGLAGMEDMEVIVICEKDFYRVRYIGEDGSDISTQYINSGDNAAEPQVPESLEAGMLCGGWSDSPSNITEDRDIYAVWAKDHSDNIVSFDNDIANVLCAVCKDERNLPFVESINALSGEDNYHIVLDLNNDGVVNMRDYSLLIKMF